MILFIDFFIGQFLQSYSSSFIFALEECLCIGIKFRLFQYDWKKPEWWFYILTSLKSSLLQGYTHILQVSAICILYTWNKIIKK